MKIVSAGVDKTTVAFLREYGVAVEPQDLQSSEDLADWLGGGLYDGVALDLEKTGIGIYAPRELRAKKIAAAVVSARRSS